MKTTRQPLTLEEYERERDAVRVAVSEVTRILDTFFDALGEHAKRCPEKTWGAYTRARGKALDIRTAVVELRHLIEDALFEDHMASFGR